MVTPVIGVICLAIVIIVALSERDASKLSYLDIHAATVVVGGVIGSLCVAIDRHSLVRMVKSVRELLPSTSVFAHEMKKTQEGLATMRKAWREGRRADILDVADRGATEELRVAADALLRQLSPMALAEHFTGVRTNYMQRTLPVIEGWEMVGKLAPSFGMVGTVTGMVQLFQHMGQNSGNLGGAMAMALLATLYGISIGAAVGGPMATRVNNQLNDRMTQLEFLEKTVAALIDENRTTGAQHT